MVDDLWFEALGYEAKTSRPGLREEEKNKNYTLDSAKDLKPLDILNYRIKYADDASLLCPENSSTSIELEMAHVIDWTRENKMTVNLLKMVELVFRRPNISNDLLQSVISDVRRVGVAKLFGVHLTQNLSFSQHIDAVVTVCNQRLYQLPASTN